MLAVPWWGVEGWGGRESGRDEGEERAGRHSQTCLDWRSESLGGREWGRREGSLLRRFSYDHCHYLSSSLELGMK